MPLSRRSFVSGTALACASLREAWAGTESGIPVLTRTDFSERLDPAYLSNGLIGIRPGPNPLAPSPTAVSGYVYTHPVHRVECLAPAPYPLMTDILVDGIGLLANADRVTPRNQTLDMHTGELTTEMDFEPRPGVRIAMSVLQFASRGTPSLVAQEVTLASDRAVDVMLVPEIATENVPGRRLTAPIPERTRDIAVALTLESEGGSSRLGIALTAIADASIRSAPTGPGYVTEIEAGRKMKFRTISAMVSSFYHPSPDLQAIRMASWGRMLGFERLREQNREQWESLWKSRVRVDAGADNQRALDVAFFYLHSSVHPSNQNGMPPFGLSQTEHYFGHSFWDTETFSLTPILLASPAAAKSLLEFRLRGLSAARHNASLFGYRGAQFPWEATQTDGSEATPTFADTGWSEQHVVPDVALAFWQYQQATADPEFLRRGTWPVLRAVAEWIESRGEFTSAGFAIRNIMGPNEGVNNTNNNAYVNLACASALEAAHRCAPLAGVTPPRVWKRIAQALILPRDRNTGAVLAYEGAQQDAFPDLSFLLPFDPPLPGGDLERTYASFKRREREYMIGFATAPASAGAAFLGDRKLATTLFEQCWRPFWMPPFGMTKEAASQSYGCFVTNFGSILQTAMLGFTGLRIRDGDWARYPASMPEGWKTIEIDRISVRGEPKRLIAVQGRKPELD
jgi:trehalose/maltose hydrolase-like predicted phosphorylase